MTHSGAKISINYWLILGTFLGAFVLGSAFAEASSDTAQITERYAQIHNNWSDDLGRKMPLEKLLQVAENYRDANPSSASAWIVVARVRFAYANTQGIVTGMRLMKSARDDLERSLELDAQAESGLGQALLGYLYMGTPPWPIGYRDTKKGADYLAAAYRLNPAGMEVNYYYGSYYGSTKRYEQALIHIEQSRQAAYKNADSPELRQFYLLAIDELQRKVVSEME